MLCVNISINYQKQLYSIRIHNIKRVHTDLYKYNVYLGDNIIGQVKHYRGNGAITLTHLVLELLQEKGIK